MKLLAIETSSARASIVVAAGERLLERWIDSPRDQAAELLPAIDALLGESGLRLAALDGLAFGRGPGSFTGVRIAAAIAQGLALATDVPLLPVSSLAALAARAWREGVAEPAVLTCVDAHMGEVYWAVYRRSDGLPGAPGGEHLGSPATVAAPEGTPWGGVGSGFRAHAAPLEPLARGAARVLPDLEPTARDLLPLAAADLAAGRITPPAEALPTYLRGEDAWRRR